MMLDWPQTKLGDTGNNDGNSQRSRNRWIASFWVREAFFDCRGMKSRCSGERPSCYSCSDAKEACNYVAAPDTPPIMALRNERDALRLRCDDFERLFQALSSTSQRDALILLERLRNGEELPSLLQLVEHMRQSSDEYQSSLRSPSPKDPEFSTVPVEEGQAAQHTSKLESSIYLLSNFTTAQQLLEPKVDVSPAMPDIRPTSLNGKSAYKS
ncbi:hypothetical protein Q7P37_007374 [Cladosporium fusiforme]